MIPSIADQIALAKIPEKQSGAGRPKKPMLRDRAIDALILWGPITLVGITVHIRCGLAGLRREMLKLAAEGLAEFKKDHKDRKQWSPTKKLLDLKRDAY